MSVAVICECNPFHYGHEYLFRTAREITGEGVVAVMSGSFIQRGEVAVCDKFTRAAAALRHGADVVVELPTAFAVASAQRFAAAGVRLAGCFSDVTALAFGCENDDLGALRAAADALRDARVNALIADAMRSGAYYPQALAAAVREVCGEAAAQAVSSPNNILAVEYLRALDGTAIRPLPVKRQGVSHDSAAVCGKFASASYIRALLRAGQSAVGLLPELPPRVTHPELLDRLMLYRLRTMSADELRRLPEVGEGLENRLKEAAGHARSADELLGMVKTKRYTHARLRRVLTCALLGVTAALQNTEPQGVRVLGFTDDGEQILRSCKCQIVTSVAKALRQTGVNTEHLRLDLRATDIAALAYNESLPSNQDYCTKIIRINREM